MATIDLTRTPCSAPASAEADLYGAIATSWYWSTPEGGHIRRPMQRFVLAPDFAESVATCPDSVYGHIVSACARIVSLYSWELHGAVVAKHAEGTGTLAKEACDPMTPMWYPLTGSSGVGVHFWRLGGGLIDIRSVGPFDRAPALEFGRFAAYERELEEKARRAVERTAGEAG